MYQFNSPKFDSHQWFLLTGEKLGIERAQPIQDRQAWQAEINRIWQYLLQQRGNGKNVDGWK